MTCVPQALRGSASDFKFFLIQAVICNAYSTLSCRGWSKLFHVFGACEEFLMNWLTLQTAWRIQLTLQSSLILPGCVCMSCKKGTSLSLLR